MKKIYARPENEVVCLRGATSLFAGSPSTDIENPGSGSTGGAFSKERSEDEEAYVATSGACETDYGNLW